MKNIHILRSCVLTVFLLLVCGVMYGQSGCYCFNCTSGHPNVNCYTSWQNERDAVVRIRTDRGEFWTGALLNTTTGDNNTHHYILTHGFSYRTSKSSDPSKWEFFWHYEAPDCSNPNSAPPCIKTTGARVVADNYCAEAVLLELLEDPTEQWDITPYYLGWDRSDEIATGLTVIYHPDGDIKKMQYSPKGTVEKRSKYEYSCNSGNVDNYPLWTTSYWAFIFGNGTEGVGGAPLFNSAHRLIGIYLWDDCDGGVCTGKKLFSNFNWAWNGWNKFQSPVRGFKDWLDPINTNPITLDGRSVVCPKTIKLWHSLPRPSYHAADSIISKQEIASGTVSYRAGTEIVLKDGFWAKPGVDFTASIEQCNNNNKSISYSSDEQNDDMMIENANIPVSSPPISYNINILPNPNNGNFKLETNFSLSEITHLKITNLLGFPVYETKHIVSNEIQLSNAVSGMCFVIIHLKDGTVLTQKMMVQ